MQVYIGTVSDNLFSVSDSRTWYFYHFHPNGVTSIGINGEQFHSTGYAQLYAIIDDNRYLTVGFISSSAKIICRDITMTLAQNRSAVLNTSLDKNHMQLTADLCDRCFVNGIYAFDAEYTFLGKNDHCKLYLFVNCASDNTEDFEFYISYGEPHDVFEDFSPAKRRMALKNLLSAQGVTINKALNPDVIYPSCASKYNCDTEYWINKSHEILDGYSNLTQGQKLLYLHDWMTSNMKYDYYKVNVLSVPRYYVGYKVNPSQYLSKTIPVCVLTSPVSMRSCAVRQEFLALS